MELFGRFPLFSSPMFDIEQRFVPRFCCSRGTATMRRGVSRVAKRAQDFRSPDGFLPFRQREETNEDTPHVEELRFTKQEKERRHFLRGEERAVRRYFSRNPGLGQGRAIAAISNKLFIRNRPR